MKSMKLMATLMTGIILSGCAMVQSDKTETPVADTLNAKSTPSVTLNYLIHYRPDSFDIVASYDIIFSNGGTTNGCTAHISGKYEDPVKSEELTLQGESCETINGFKRSDKRHYRYYLYGVIKKPVDEKTMDANTHALSVHVEEITESKFTSAVIPKYENCNKRDSNSFKTCMNKNFPAGSSYSELKLFLINQGFKQAKDPKSPKDCFYFFWWANDLSNYKVVVTGRYNSELKITEINILL